MATIDAAISNEFAGKDLHLQIIILLLFGYSFFTAGPSK
jgi:hypothetical protein